MPFSREFRNGLEVSLIPHESWLPRKAGGVSGRVTPAACPLASGVQATAGPHQLPVNQMDSAGPQRTAESNSFYHTGDHHPPRPEVSAKEGPLSPQVQQRSPETIPEATNKEGLMLLGGRGTPLPGEPPPARLAPLLHLDCPMPLFPGTPCNWN